MKKQHAGLLPLIATGIVPSVAVTTALLPAQVLAAPGDLDPAFGDVGRLGPILNGPAWSVQPQDDGTMILGGGRPGYSYYYWGGPYYSPPTQFVSRLTGTGAIDPNFVAADVAEVQVLDVVTQPDGQVVAVGRRNTVENPDVWQLAAFRLQPDGALDSAFAGNGTFLLSTEEHGQRHLATAVTLDPDGRIVIAGSRDDKVVVLRLLPDGSIDDSFGTSGLVAGPDNRDLSSDGSGARTSLIRVADGGYRLTASNAAGCQLIALTASGTIDDGFGTSGVTLAQASAGASAAVSAHCNDLATQADERLLVAGRVAGRGFVSRVLADGQPDPAFSGGVVANALTDATAVEQGADGTIAVGGQSDGMSTLLRLQANGEIDAQFGDTGTTTIDFGDAFYTTPVVHDLFVGADGSVVVAGGDDIQAFAVRLLGNEGGESPGVIGFTDNLFVAGAEGGEAVLTLRRTGGASGEVSVAYDFTRGGWESAFSGADFDFDPGVLSWPDGDRSEREIRIPILTDDAIEGPEYFGIALSNPQGGPGLAATTATAEIPADGGPHGQLSMSTVAYGATEGFAAAIMISREFYSTGAVSVILTPTSGTATAGLDFDASPVTVSWADGEVGTKQVNIPIVDDTDEEAAEQFTVELTNPAGGAIVTRPSLATVYISFNDRPLNAGDSGGGAMGFLSMLLLGAATFFRRVFRAKRSPPQ